MLLVSKDHVIQQGEGVLNVEREREREREREIVSQVNINYR